MYFFVALLSVGVLAVAGMKLKRNERRSSPSVQPLPAARKNVSLFFTDADDTVLAMTKQGYRHDEGFDHHIYEIYGYSIVFHLSTLVMKNVDGGRDMEFVVFFSNRAFFKMTDQDTFADLVKKMEKVETHLSSDLIHSGAEGTGVEATGDADKHKDSKMFYEYIDHFSLNRWTTMNFMGDTTSTDVHLAMLTANKINLEFERERVGFTYAFFHKVINIADNSREAIRLCHQDLLSKMKEEFLSDDGKLANEAMATMCEETRQDERIEILTSVFKILRVKVFFFDTYLELLEDLFNADLVPEAVLLEGRKIVQQTPLWPAPSFNPTRMLQYLKWRTLDPNKRVTDEWHKGYHFAQEYRHIRFSATFKTATTVSTETFYTTILDGRKPTGGAMHSQHMASTSIAEIIYQIFFKMGGKQLVKKADDEYYEPKNNIGENYMPEKAIELKYRPGHVKHYLGVVMVRDGKSYKMFTPRKRRAYNVRRISFGEQMWRILDLVRNMLKEAEQDGNPVWGALQRKCAWTGMQKIWWRLCMGRNTRSCL
eukprot:Platyproteum_vivax@DN7633_c1_g1_i2.p1